MIDFFTASGGYILPFIFVLTIVVFFHELGHFLVARACRVKVETFSVGFGRALISRPDRHGTEWKLGWLPLGGYVKFAGDSNAASTPDADELAAMDDDARKDTLFYKPLWQRSAVVAAGPVANFILAILIFAGLYTTLGQRVIDPVIGSVIEESAAERAGLQVGDRVLEIDGETIETFNELRRAVTLNAEQPLTFTILRGGSSFEQVIIPDRKRTTDRFGNAYDTGQLGVSVSVEGDAVRHVRYGVLDGLQRGVEESYFIVEQTFVMLGRIILGRENADNLGGPIRIAQLSGQTASVGLVALINLTAVLSVSIGLINLFPIPMLDGGHLMFYAYEAVFGRPLSARAQEAAMRIGLGLVIALFAFVTWQDLARLDTFGALARFFGF